MLEAVILSVTPSYLYVLEKKDQKLFKKIAYLKNDIEKPLASILTFNTIAHTVGAAGAGAEAQKYWGNEYLSLFSAVLTFVILFFSEIIPKSIGAKSWKGLLPFAHILLTPMILLSMPVVWLSGQISKIINGNQGSDISRDEIPAMAEIGLKSGIIKKSEYRALTSLFKFGEVKLKSVLKPAEESVGLEHNATLLEALKEIRSNSFSRLLVFGVSRNDIKGYVLRKDILEGFIDQKKIKIKDLTKKMLILPDSTRGQEMFDRLLAMKAHIAAVIDDNGEFLGIVTLEDLIESIIGQEIFDEFDL